MLAAEFLTPAGAGPGLPAAVVEQHPPAHRRENSQLANTPSSLPEDEGGVSIGAPEQRRQQQHRYGTPACRQSETRCSCMQSEVEKTMGVSIRVSLPLEDALSSQTLRQRSKQARCTHPQFPEHWQGVITSGRLKVSRHKGHTIFSSRRVHANKVTQQV